LKRSAPLKDEPTPKLPKVTLSTGTYTKAADKDKSTVCSETYTKKSRRRSKSVDFAAGDKTVIAPQACEECSAQAKRRRPEDSPTLPWCTHQETFQFSLNITPSRSLQFKGRSLLTSTPLIILK